MSKLTDKLLKGVKINHGAALLSESKTFDIRKEDFISTPIPMLNTALSGDPSLGLSYGVTLFAGPSKHFKTSYGLVLAKAFQDKFKDGVVLYLDSEFGGTEYLDTYGIDRDRVVHVPIANVEELKFNLSSILEDWDKNDKLFVFCDSLGNLASKKEVEDSLNEKSVADMSRAKQMKSLFRIITPTINLKRIYTYFIQHTYKSQDFMPTDVVAGGTGAMYSADNVFIIGRSQEKDSNGLSGYNFKIKVEKSRFIREKSVIDIIATFDNGILPYSGLVDVALECGYVEKVRSRGNVIQFQPKKGELMKIPEKKIAFPESKDFWITIMKETDLIQSIIKKYKL